MSGGNDVEDPSKAFSLNNLTGQLLTGEVKADYECDVQYIVNLEVSDSGEIGGGPAAYTRGKVVVDIHDRNDPPRIKVLDTTIETGHVECLQGTLCRIVPENSKEGYELMSASTGGKLETQDDDKASIAPTYELLNGTDLFELDASTGLLKILLNDSLNFEDPAQNKYVLKIKATDYSLITNNNK